MKDFETLKKEMFPFLIGRIRTIILIGELSTRETGFHSS